MNNILIDIDGTISEVFPQHDYYQYKNAKVVAGSLQSVNTLHDAGNIITFLTIRPENFKEVTENWLQQNGFKYHALIMNKSKASKYYWINNKDVQAIKYQSNWKLITDKLSEPKTEEIDLEEKNNYFAALQNGVNYII